MELGLLFFVDSVYTAGGIADRSFTEEEHEGVFLVLILFDTRNRFAFPIGEIRSEDLECERHRRSRVDSSAPVKKASTQSHPARHGHHITIIEMQIRRSKEDPHVKYVLIRELRKWQ
jgi:hypothetical protein